MTSSTDTAITTLDAAEFEARCLELLDELAENGGELVVTRDGRPAFRILPCREQAQTRGDPKAFFGADQGRIEILGDIVSPMPAAWFTDSADGAEDES